MTHTGSTGSHPEGVIPVQAGDALGEDSGDSDRETLAEAVIARYPSFDPISAAGIADAVLAAGFRRPATGDTEQCSRCGGPNVIWSCQSPLWNYVMRGNDINGEPRYRDLVCMACFIRCAVEAGLPEKGWRLTLVPEPVGLLYETPSGRVWDEERFLWVTPPAARDAGGVCTRFDAPESCLTHGESQDRACEPCAERGWPATGDTLTDAERDQLAKLVTAAHWSLLRDDALAHDIAAAGRLSVDRIICPTCGQTTTEPHPRRDGVMRCTNCKEHLTADPAPCPRCATHAGNGACGCGR